MFEKEFTGTDLHSRMCEWVYQTADYYDLKDWCEVDETPEEKIWNLSDAELIDAIKYALENEPNLNYVYDLADTLDAKSDGKKLIEEYEKEQNK